MSASIYYTARRNHPLTPAERLAVDTIIAEFAVENQIEQYCQSGQGFNWESVCVHDSNKPTEPGVIFEGATKLPDNSEDAIWVGVRHWCELLTRIRHKLPGASWNVLIDDYDIVWDNDRKTYDPSQ